MGGGFTEFSKNKLGVGVGGWVSGVSGDSRGGHPPPLRCKMLHLPQGSSIRDGGDMFLLGCFASGRARNVPIGLGRHQQRARNVPPGDPFRGIPIGIP